MDFTGKKEEVELISKARYEVELNMEWAKKYNDPDDKYISCKFKIRDDINQAFQGRVVFDPIYKDKATGEYNKKKINGLLSAIENPKLSFEDYDEIIQYLNGQKMNIMIDIEPANQFHEKDKNIVKYLSYEISKYANYDGTAGANKETNKPGVVTVDAGDLPF